MLLRGPKGDVLDYSLDLLGELIDVLDSHLERLRREARAQPDPDAFGIFDSFEFSVGVGFVACQGYIAATCGACGVAKREAMRLGPMHRSGYSIAELVNYAANHWKHDEESVSAPSSTATARRRSALAVLLPGASDYPLAGVLAAIVAPGPPRLRALLPHLEAWRDSVLGSA